MTEIFGCDCKKPDLFYDIRSKRLRCRGCRRRFSQPVRLMGDPQDALHEELVRLLRAAGIHQVLWGNDPQKREHKDWVPERGSNLDPLVVGAENIEAILKSSSPS